MRRTDRGSRHLRSSRLSETALLAGWLFADVMLALAVVFLGAIRGESPARAAVSDPVGSQSPVVLSPENGAFIASDSLLAIGEGPPGSLIVVEIDGSKACESRVDSKSSWVCYVQDLADGPHVMESAVQDSSSPASGPAIVEFTVDTQAPVLTMGVTPDRLSMVGQGLRVRGTCTEDAPVTITVGRFTRSTDCINGRFLLNLTDPRALIEEGLPVSVSQEDPAGNIGSRSDSLALAESGIELESVHVYLKVSSRGALLNRSSQAIEEVVEQLREALVPYAGRRAGMVLTFGVAEDSGTGVLLSRAVIELLPAFDADMFGGSILRDGWHARPAAGEVVDVEIFFLVE